MRVLVVDDQRSARLVIKKILARLEGIEIVEASTAEQAVQQAEKHPPDLLLIDIRLTADPRDRQGLDVVTTLRSRGIATPAIMVTALTEVAEIREAMRRGAQDYVFKDELAPELLLPIVKTHQESLSLKRRIESLQQRVDHSWGLAAIVGSSEAMEELRSTIARVADSEVNVLIRGETGSGKELVARALHHLSGRRDAPMIAVNCSTLPGTLIESLVFGHMRGAFTGADRTVRGQLELAGSGTLLLDEIAEMPVELQSKLLRVLEDRKFRPLGSEKELPLQARVLAATHADLERRIQEGAFRRDLFFRLNVVVIRVPALVEHLQDIPELLLHFARDFDRPLRFTDDAVKWMMARTWPGNVRELRNVVNRLALLSKRDTIDTEVLDGLVRDVPGLDVAAEVDRLARELLALPDRLGSKLDLIERAILHHAIESSGGNKSAAARLVGVHRKTLERRWDRFDGEHDVDEGEED